MEVHTPEEVPHVDTEQSRLYDEVIDEVPTPATVPDSDHSTTAVAPSDPKPVEPSLEATQVVPTPCRNASKSANAGPDTPVFTDHESPDPKDTETPGSKEASTPGSISTDLESERPTPGELRLSQNAVNLRMHRMMKVDSKGNSKVSTEIRKQWNSKKGKLRLQQLFQTCGYDPDWCLKNLWWETLLIICGFNNHTI